MRPIIAAGFLLALAACQPQAPDGQPAPPPADAPPAQAPPAAATLPVAFAGDLDAVGTEPFWAVSIAKGTVTLTRPDYPDVAAPAAVPRMENGRAVWTQKVGEEPFVVTLWKDTCTDGMSDRSFPLTAEVRMGELTLKGCASKAGTVSTSAP